MTDPVRIISPYLAAPEEPIRCAAARALGALGEEDAAPALVATLLDPDPDVRADAMGALVRCARPQDAPAIRRSLQGDPVGEVKTAAVRALGRLEDAASTPLLRALARDRCEPEVVWEEGAWDDWLDVQVAAITALGDMGVEAAVDDLIRARADEDAQDLDHVVFAALAKMPGRGIAALLDFLKDSDARVRRRALAALPHAGPDLLTPLRDRLVDDPGPGVRRLVVDVLDAGDPALPALARKDPAGAVRAAALRRVAPARPDICRAALADSDPEVRAAAVEALAARVPPGGVPALAAGLEAWLREGDARVAAACAAALPKVKGSAALGPLREAASDGDRLAEVRIAALRSLAETGTPEAVATLRAAAVDAVRQVRLAALAAAAALTRAVAGDARGPARDLLIDAVRGRLRTGESTGDADVNQNAFGSEPGASGPLAITPEGGIVAPGASAGGGTDDAGGEAGERPYPLSTLEAIQATGLELRSGEDPVSPSGERLLKPSSHRPPRPSGGGAPSPAPGAGARRRRVPVEGVDDVAVDIRLAAVRLAADCVADGIDESLAEAAESTTSELRAAAFEAIAQRAAAMPLSPVLRTVLARSLGCDDPRVRCAAARGLAGADAAGDLAPLLDDADASVRAAAVTAVAAVHPARVVTGVRDPSPLVRRAAVDAAVAAGEDRFLEDGLRALVDGGWADSLMDACARHNDVAQRLIGMLSASEVSRPRLRTILEALGGC